jgi:hypothetical protein
MDLLTILMIKCPHTARPVDTGIEIKIQDFDTLLDVARTVECTACGMLHAWRKEDAWLVDYAGNPITTPPAILRSS